MQECLLQQGWLPSDKRQRLLREARRKLEVAADEARAAFVDAKVAVINNSGDAEKRVSGTVRGSTAASAYCVTGAAHHYILGC
jgi:hypothetical protein